MIRKFPGHDTDNPPGCVQYDPPLVNAVEQYLEDTSKTPQNDASAAFEAGYWVGYQQARTDALKAVRHLDPNSEGSR